MCGGGRDGEKSGGVMGDRGCVEGEKLGKSRI